MLGTESNWTRSFRQETLTDYSGGEEPGRTTSQANGTFYLVPIFGDSSAIPRLWTLVPCGCRHHIIGDGRDEQLAPMQVQLRSQLGSENHAHPDVG
jgi:hypothetical protein